MKKISIISFIFISMFLTTQAYVEAAVITCDTNPTFASQTKEVKLSYPSECASFQGEIAFNNCTIVSVKEEYLNKELAYNASINKFIVYGLNKELAIGSNLIIELNIPNNALASISIVNPLGATPEALPILIDQFDFQMTSLYDVNNDGLLNVDDVVDEIQYIFDNNATVTDLQIIINNLIDEIDMGS